MLGKLIKYEWKATYKICGALLLFMAIMSIAGCASFYTPMWKYAFNDSRINRVSPLDILGVFTLLAYILSIVGVIWGMMIYLGVHFYRTMYADEGYLTHTLPVTSHQLLAGRIIVSGLWYLLVMVLMCLSFFGLAYSLINAAYSAYGGGESLWAWITRNWDTINWGFSVNTIGDIITYFLMILVTPFTSVTILFGAITLGQLSAKHKVMMSIVSYFVISFISQMLVGLLSIPLTVSSTLSSLYNSHYSGGLYMPTYALTIGVGVVLSVVLYFISNYIITKKLNLD